MFGSDVSFLKQKLDPQEEKKKVFCSSVSNEHTHSMGEEGFFRISKEFFFFNDLTGPFFQI